jgi:hypothetical protein
MEINDTLHETFQKCFEYVFSPDMYPKPKEIIYRKAMSLTLNIHYNMHKLIIQSTKEKCER